ncbi:hypothetical protein [Aquimarina rhabdastrellae]
MTKMQTILSLISIFYVPYTIIGQLRIIKTVSLSKIQKIYHSAAIWFIPFFWLFLLKDRLKSNRKVMTKNTRDRLLRAQGSIDRNA